MKKREIDIPKTIFISIILIVVSIIIVGIVLNRINTLDRRELYDGETYISQVIKDYEEELVELTNNSSYEYDNLLINVFDYDVVGDKLGNNGIRYYDGVHQKDNDIIKLIPKDFFFLISPNGYNYVGEKYGFYIKTIKDLEEEALDSAGYNSNNYYKSIVILYALDSHLPHITKTCDEYYVNVEVIAINEYHSYKKVDESKGKQLDPAVVSDIKSNGVVTYFGSAKDKNISINNIKYGLNLLSLTSFNEYGDSFDLTNDVSTELKGQLNEFSKVSFKIISPDGEKNDMRLNIAYSFNIIDGIWKEETNLSDINTTVEINKEHYYSFRFNELIVDQRSDIIFTSNLDYASYFILGTGERLKITTQYEEAVVVYNSTTKEYVDVVNNVFESNIDNEYIILCYKNQNKFSEIIVNVEE